MCSESLSVETVGLSKSYRIYDEPKDRLKQFLWRGRRSFYREFWALHPIDLKLRAGECIGFVGRNGSGKSTLLQLIAGIVSPTSGSVRVSGRVSALLELGAGFNPDFTGRENVSLNAAILGLSERELAERFQNILEFAEIGDFIDQPVKTYSSGMYVRLAFSVAIHVDPKVLIVDEALAVGDAAFQYKCFSKLDQLRAQGMSILFVSHDLGAIKRYCDRAGWLNEGHLISFGDAVDVADQFEDYLRKQMVPKQNLSAGSVGVEIKSDEKAVVGAHARLLKAELLNAQGGVNAHFVTGCQLTLRIRYESLTDEGHELVVGGAVFRSDDLYVCGLNTALDGYKIPSARGVHEVSLCYDKLQLLAGSYYFKVGVFDSSARVVWGFEHFTCPFTVTAPYIAEGVVVLDHTWRTTA